MAHVLLYVVWNGSVFDNRWAIFSLRMGQFSYSVATHPHTNEIDMIPGIAATMWRPGLISFFDLWHKKPGLSVCEPCTFMT